MTRAVDVNISGRVQGVFFRRYAAQEADRLELSGWVRNEPDGSVAAHFEGPSHAVDEMVAWCRRGSPGSQVDELEVREVDPTGSASFEVEY